MDIKNVLLTGHRGFIGKNLYKELKSLGINVYTVEMDFLNDPYWKEVLYNKVKRSDIIFHVGAISDTTLKDSQKMLLYNYEFSKVLIDHARDLAVKVIYSSSAANEGNGNGIPNNIYGWSKLLVENYGIAKGGSFVSLRYFNVYGPGEEHKGKMASIISDETNSIDRSELVALVRKRRSSSVFGNVATLSDIFKVAEQEADMLVRDRDSKEQRIALIHGIFVKFAT